jgi:tetratricopeptide (TPR) repeat protein
LAEEAQMAGWWMMAGLFFGPTPASEGLARLESMAPLTRGSVSAEAAYLRAKARFLWIQGRFDEARECLTRWEAIERELGRRTRLSSVHGHYLGPLELAAGNYEAAAASGRRGFEEQSALGDRGYSATAAGQLAHALLAMGENEEAEHYAREALDRSASDDLEPKISGNGALGVALARRGELSEAERMAREAVTLARETDYTMNLADVLIDLARVLALTGEADEARAAIDEAVEILERKEAWALADRAREAAAAL